MRSHLFATAAALAALGAAPAFAADDATPVSELVVLGVEGPGEIPGAATLVTAEEFERSQPLSINDVLRRVPGLYVRSEEGLGLRPNVGFRGLNPSRSTEVLFLEDGVPLTYAPYGDNATYYHPPLERFSAVEVLKGAGQIVYGPHTVGGVINYRTPRPPENASGRLIARVGENDTQEFVLQGGDTFGRLGLIGGVAAGHSAGVRANQDLVYADAFLKAVATLSETQELTFKLSAYHEDSRVSYSGLTQAEYLANPRGNRFKNDSFTLWRYGASAAHGWRPSGNLQVNTVLYAASFERDWWRQSSNSAQRPADASDPLCGGMANVDTTCGNEGRLRQYYMFGLENRVTLNWAGGELLAGARIHAENQERFQINGDFPNSRSPGVTANAGVREQNVREARAVSAFVQNTFRFGDFAVTPGVRFETMDFGRSNKLTGQRGSADLSEWIPGLGLSWSADPRLTVFAGVHRGFSPPRVEDVITAAGGSVELDAERSLNWEFGVRGEPVPGLKGELAAFRMDFDNQIVPASVAGGVGATATSAGETRHMGLEGAASFSSRAAFGTTVDWYAEGTFTWVETAEYRGRRFSAISGFGNVPVTGNRLPYSPEWVGRAALGFDTGALQAELEAVYTGEMFTDDLNTRAPTADGQRGRIDSAWQWNLAAAWRVPNTRVKLTAAVRNLADKTYIVDRSRGVLVSEPRTAILGVELNF
ncbi:MAG: TonB-dependent receptor family protein [Phenylobacterium sp.]|uniref:TonB-dependent receptor family protein n=1 Tax=Phenylobacterium sp. TaxID=1871053 RepID=UPI00391BDF3A